MLEQATAGTCGPVKRVAHDGAGLLPDLCDSAGDPYWKSVPEGLHSGAVLVEL